MISDRLVQDTIDDLSNNDTDNFIVHFNELLPKYNNSKYDLSKFLLSGIVTVYYGVGIEYNPSYKMLDTIIELRLNPLVEYTIRLFINTRDVDKLEYISNKDIYYSSHIGKYIYDSYSYGTDINRTYNVLSELNYNEAIVASFIGAVINEYTRIFISNLYHHNYTEYQNDRMNLFLIINELEKYTTLEEIAKIRANSYNSKSFIFYDILSYVVFRVFREDTLQNTSYEALERVFKMLCSIKTKVTKPLKYIILSYLPKYDIDGNEIYYPCDKQYYIKTEGYYSLFTDDV